MDRREELEARWNAVQAQLDLIRQIPPERAEIDLQQLEESLLERLDAIEFELGRLFDEFD